MLIWSYQFEILDGEEALHLILVLALDCVVLKADFEVGVGFELATSCCLVGLENG